MPWTILLISAALEAVWATALGESEGLSRVVPALVFVVALSLSMVGLARAVRTIPIGTAYAVWTGTGAALTVGWAMLTGTQEPSGGTILFLSGIVAAVVGLKLLPEDDAGPPR